MDNYSGIALAIPPNSAFMKPTLFKNKAALMSSPPDMIYHIRPIRPIPHHLGNQNTFSFYPLNYHSNLLKYSAGSGAMDLI